VSAPGEQPNKEGTVPSTTDITPAGKVRAAQLARELLSRVVRQVGQTLLPTLAAAAVAGGISGMDYAALFSVAIITALVTVLRAVTKFRVPAPAALWLQAVDRAAAAAAGTALGLIAAGPGFDVFTAPWVSILDVSAASAVLALVTTFTNPPLNPAEPNADGALPLAAARPRPDSATAF
jgi:hypothetical protein